MDQKNSNAHFAIFSESTLRKRLLSKQHPHSLRHREAYLRQAMQDVSFCSAETQTNNLFQDLKMEYLLLQNKITNRQKPPKLGPSIFQELEKAIDALPMKNSCPARKQIEAKMQTGKLQTQGLMRFCMNETYFGSLQSADNSKQFQVIIKPRLGEVGDASEDWPGKEVQIGTYLYRSRFASILSQLLGLNSIIPPTVLLNSPELGEVSVQIRIPELHPLGGYGSAWSKLPLNQNDLLGLAIFDYLFQSNDRHLGNIGMSEDHLYGIDNDLGCSSGKIMSFAIQYCAGYKISKTHLEKIRLLNQKPLRLALLQIVKLIDPLQGEKIFNRMFKHIEQLLKTKTIPEHRGSQFNSRGLVTYNKRLPLIDRRNARI